MLGLTKLAEGPGNVALVERPEPELRPGHAILRVLGSGICGTDLHILAGEYGTNPPVTMGHEVCAVVEAVGDGVDPHWTGRRVVSEVSFSTCDDCVHCRAGRLNLCTDRHALGARADGAFAPLMLVPERLLHPAPERLSDEAAALTEPLACVCQAMFEPAAVTAGDRVLVTGPGPIGLLAAQVARACGGRVHVRGAERDRDRLALATELGFETSVHGVEEPPEVDVAVECSGSAGGIATCLERTRRGGRYVQVGLGGKPVTVPFDNLCYRELTLTSGFGSARPAWLRALALIEAGAVELQPLVTEVVPLAEWERVFAALADGVGVKYVLDPR